MNDVLHLYIYICNTNDDIHTCSSRRSFTVVQKKTSNHIHIFRDDQLVVSQDAVVRLSLRINRAFCRLLEEQVTDRIHCLHEFALRTRSVYRSDLTRYRCSRDSTHVAVADAFSYSKLIVNGTTGFKVVNESVVAEKRSFYVDNREKWSSTEGGKNKANSSRTYRRAGTWTIREIQNLVHEKTCLRIMSRTSEIFTSSPPYNVM